MECIICGKDCEAQSFKKVDGKAVCMDCLYRDTAPVMIWPIGTVVNDKKRKKKGFGTTAGDVSEIHLLPAMEMLMKGLSEESHLTVIWYLSETREIKSLFRRGWDKKMVGPFASRTPDRLTPIGVSDVEILEVIGTVIKVRGLDAINGTPVLDIKVGMESLKGRGRSDKAQGR